MTIIILYARYLCSPPGQARRATIEYLVYKLLFSIYINDMINVCKFSVPLLFADDGALSFVVCKIPLLAQPLGQARARR